ncbi:MAG: Nramp family divalent metal transporter [Parachlamydiaceae bacterium]|nr:Nramp family divalent metal transporter [Parachlamydiaceae bacterium]
MSEKKSASSIFRKLGPGLITGASDDDPSGIATYSQAGARFGISLLWTALITYPLMFALQEMCARIGIINCNGLAGVLRTYYPRILGYLLLILVVPAIVINIAADLAGMAAVAHLLFPFISPLMYSFIFALAIVFFLIFFSYNQVTVVLKYCCLSLICYLIVPFLVEQNWKENIFATFTPTIKWNKEWISMLVAILGTTISPYLFYWQASMSCEHINHNDNSIHKEIKEMRLDVNIGMFLSNLVMYFVILTTGTVLFGQGSSEIKTVEDAAEALKPLAGEFAYIIFSIGILGLGFLSIPILAGCIGYIFSETFNWKKGLDKKLFEAKSFYIVIILSVLLGVLLNVFGIDPIKSLIVTAIIYGMITPFVIMIILHICNSKKIMGNHVNSLLMNILGIICMIITSLAAIALIITLFV